MRIRHLVTLGMIAAILLVGGRAVWSELEARQTETLERADAEVELVERDAAGLLVLGQDYLLHASPRAARQWVSLHRELQQALDRFEASSREVVAHPHEMRDAVESLPGLFAALQSAVTASNADAVPGRVETLADHLVAETRRISDGAFDLAESIGTKRRAMAKRQRLVDTVSQSLLLVLVLAAAFFITRRVLVPIERLRLTAGAVRGGDLSARSGYRIADEIGNLSRDFDSMTADLQQREAISAASQQRLMRSEAFQERAGRIGGVGGWELDLRTRTVVWSTQARRLHEVADDIDLTVKRSLTFFTHEARALLHDVTAKAEQSGDPWSLELPFVTATGRSLWISSIGEAEWEDGRVVRLVGTLQDVTARRAARDALQQARHEAEEANAAKSAFLATTSHEIRTPMNAILGMLDLLQKTPLTARQRDYALKTEGAARLLLGILNDILDFSKIEAGKLGLDPRPFRVQQVLDDVSMILSGYLREKMLAVRFDLDPALPAGLVGDDMRLSQVLMNLGSNAIKFTPRGEVVVRVRVLDRTADDALIEFAVLDTGVGIAPEHLKRIFTGFSQAETSTTRRFGGSGLGLTISQRLVGMMGGEIRVESAADEGSAFYFEIRLLVADVAHDPVVEPSRSRALVMPRLKGMRLLVVEDNPDNQQVARELLGFEGAEVQLADNGLLGVAAVAGASLPFDAVLMDVQMPQMDGYEATARIRERWPANVLPIIAMTANALASDREACLAAGMNDHVGKPFDLSIVVSALRRHTGWANMPGSTAARPSASGLPRVLADALARGIALGAALQRQGGHTRTYLRLLSSFLDDLSQLPDEFARLLEQDRLADAERLMHTVKGLAATLGMQRLADFAIDAEKQLSNPAGGKVDATLAAGFKVAATVAVRDATPVMAALQTAVNKAEPAASGHATDLDALHSALDELDALLERGDMRAVEAFEELRRNHAADMPGVLEPLEAAVTRLDFGGAREHCSKLMREILSPVVA
ncbi:MAG: ATP-binding protein, partial [Caldimonas sp.]